MATIFYDIILADNLNKANGGKPDDRLGPGTLKTPCSRYVINLKMSSVSIVICYGGRIDRFLRY